MSTEVELKAHVENPQALRQKIVSVLNVLDEKEIIKQDIYYALTSRDGPAFRIRVEGQKSSGHEWLGSIIFTRKEHQRDAGIETNSEYEFSVSIEQKQNVEAFCRSLGLKEFLRKEKKGWSWYIQDSPLHVELIEVVPLGWFLEVEAVCDTPKSSREILEIKKALVNLLKTLEIPLENIEHRYYMEMLREKS